MLPLLVIVALGLLVFSLREGFDATDLIKDPAFWDAAEFSRIRTLVTPASTATDAELLDVVGGFWTIWRNATLQITMQDITRYLKSKPAEKQAEYSNLLKVYYIDQGQSVFDAARQKLPPEEIPRVTEEEQQRPPQQTGTTTGTTTGGSSTSLGPTSGVVGGGSKQGVWGPVVTGKGTPSTSTTANGGPGMGYPELMGGRSASGNPSTMLEGVGIVPPSISSTWMLGLSGATLPETADPYRLSRSFSSATYSPKQEPAPFLTDFGAFQK